MTSGSEKKKRRVLVTGASKGIGRGVALRLGRAAFDVCVHFGSDAAGAAETVRSIMDAGGQATSVGFNVNDRAATLAALEGEIAARGAFWGVVCNAGITRDNAFPAISGEDWDDVVSTSLNGFYNVVHPLTMPMVRARQGGRIVVMASVSGVMGNRGQVNYSAAKAGLIGAAKALAVELASRNITVNAVAPGLIETDMSKDLRPEVMAAIPMKRMGSVNEVAGLVEFLFRDEAAYITRQVIGVNGGLI